MKSQQPYYFVFQNSEKAAIFQTNSVGGELFSCVNASFVHNNFLCFNLPTKIMANLTQNEICAVLCSKRQYKQHDGEKMAMWKNFVCQRDQERDIHYTTINKFDVT